MCAGAARRPYLDGRAPFPTRYIREQNDDANPFVWTKPADSTLAKLKRLPVPSERVGALGPQGCANWSGRTGAAPPDSCSPKRLTYVMKVPVVRYHAQAAT